MNLTDNLAKITDFVCLEMFLTAADECWRPEKKNFRTTIFDYFLDEIKKNKKLVELAKIYRKRLMDFLKLYQSTIC
jgi:hypothetical protein